MYILNNEFDLEKFISLSDICIIDFYANWCEPCKKIAPFLASIENSSDNMNVVKVNIDEFTEIANIYKVKSLPTLVFYKNGKLTKYKHMGFDEKTISKSVLDIIGKINT